MSADFSEYANGIDEFEQEFRDAERVLSPQGLQHYLEGWRAVRALGHEPGLELAYLQGMPGVAVTVGEAALPEVVAAVLKLSSLTSAAVVILMLAQLPMVAQRFERADALLSFLKLLHHLARTAPRGLRPMMTVLDELVSGLTPGGLRRWVEWGAQVHARDLEGQMAYFGLETRSARAVFHKVRSGTMFADHQRKLNFYLRALWGRAFLLRPITRNFEVRRGVKPFIEDVQIRLPDVFGTFRGIDGLDIYRAAAAHAAAHMMYTRAPLSAEKLTPAQMRCIELFEDARVEYLAYRDFPGLRTLWLSFFTAERKEHDEYDTPRAAMELMLRTTRAMMDRTYRDEQAVVNKTADEFIAELEVNPHAPRMSWIAGLRFYDMLTKCTHIPGERMLGEWPIPYRDDNRYIWAFSEHFMFSENVDDILETRSPDGNQVSVAERLDELGGEQVGDEASDVYQTEPLPGEESDISYREGGAGARVSEPFYYHEWDYQMQSSRPEWVTVGERCQSMGDPAVMDDILTRHKPVASRIRHLIDAMQPQGVVRRRGYEEGAEQDLNAAVRAMVDIRRGIMPDPRINIRVARHTRDLSIVVLMDLSESTNEKIGALHRGEDGYEDQPSILDLTREAAGLLAWAIDAIGDKFAVHGFASDGRHDVQYYRFKDFEHGYGSEAKARLAGMQGGLSTRMGAALRHSGAHLTRQTAQKRLVLLITDGEPADIDERDPQYLRHDAKKAVEELASGGIYTYCLTLDPNADRYVARIFGENNYSIVDNVERLPERLPKVFAAITG